MTTRFCGDCTNMPHTRCLHQRAGRSGATPSSPADGCAFYLAKTSAQPAAKLDTARCYPCNRDVTISADGYFRCPSCGRVWL